jgi:phage/plasmid-like protein (TIGR03299 family)|tara:strand:- start:21178 stop:22266 length:1089 start_codon:yes stop_codon:yes gene_type:complete
MLDMTRGEATMAYVKGKVPWHGLGRGLDPTDTPTQWWTKACDGAPWDVAVVPVEYHWPADIRTKSPEMAVTSGLAYRYAPKQRIAKNQFLIVRNDTGDVLSPKSISHQYKVHSIGDILEFTDKLCKEAGFSPETIISLHGGRKITVLARATRDTFICGKHIHFDQDKISHYVLITTSFDSSLRTCLSITRVRVVCWNTLQQALQNNEELLRITHKEEFIASSVYDQLTLVEESHKEFREDANFLATVPIGDKGIRDYFIRVASNIRFDNYEELMDIEHNEEDKKSVIKRADKFITVYNTGLGQRMPTAEGTAWGAVNAVMGVADHWGTDKGRAGRFSSSFFGSGAAMKERAWDEALELARAA